jgi:hypothetical protein
MPGAFDEHFAVISANVEAFAVHEITNLVALFVLAKFGDAVGRGN